MFLPTVLPNSCALGNWTLPEAQNQVVKLGDSCSSILHNLFLARNKSSTKLYCIDSRLLGERKNMAKKITKAMRADFKRCEELAYKIMDECGVEIPFLTWAFMTYDELLNLEKELKKR